MATATLQAPVFRIRFRTSAKSALTLWIEPLGDQVAIPGGTTVEVHCTEQLGHPNEFETSDHGITVHGWVRSVYAVGMDGQLQLLWALPGEGMDEN
jgi:hypothetical protein